MDSLKTNNYLAKAVVLSVNPQDIPFADLSRKTEKVFIEIAPFTKGDDGKYLNENHYSILKENGTVNVDDKIQSHFEDCDLLTIISRVERAGESITDVYPQSDLQYGDMSVIPDNMNDAFIAKKRAVAQGQAVLGKDLMTALIDDDPEFDKKLDAMLDRKFKERYPDFNHDGTRIVKPELKPVGGDK